MRISDWSSDVCSSDLASEGRLIAFNKDWTSYTSIISTAGSLPICTTAWQPHGVRNEPAGCVEWMSHTTRRPTSLTLGSRLRTSLARRLPHSTYSLNMEMDRDTRGARVWQ